MTPQANCEPKEDKDVLNAAELTMQSIKRANQIHNAANQLSENKLNDQEVSSPVKVRVPK